MTSRLQKAIDAIERELGRYYDFSAKAAVNDHLVDRTLLEQFPSVSGDRASVVFAQEEDEVFIGLFIDESLVGQLEGCDPTRQISNANIDAFSVLVEEISHFHLILNRISDEQKVSRLELELQAEIDKLLVSGLFLERQYGDHHIEALMKLMFEKCVLPSNDPLYLRASQLAKIHWQDVIRQRGADALDLQEAQVLHFMRSNYERPIDLKKRFSKCGSRLSSAA